MNDEREILGRGILHKLSELKNPRFYGNFSLYLNIKLKNIPLHKVATKNIIGEIVYEDFMLDSEGVIYCYRNQMMNIRDWEEMDDNPIVSRIPLREPKDFLNVSIEATISLNKAVTDDSFFDNLAWLLNKQDKPGYSNVWIKDVEKEKRKSLTVRMPEDP
jgi:hypothetical protein